MRTTDIIEHISRYGIERSGPQLARLARAAERAGVTPAIISLLTDDSAAPIVRERAAARVAAALANAPHHPWLVAA